MHKNLARRLALALAALWRCARTRHEPLDDATLRDLGIARSELPSFGAEAEGSVDITRLRLASRHVVGA
jgi:uncharacterized protein YjiS (DUF1127 family)